MAHWTQHQGAIPALKHEIVKKPPCWAKMALQTDHCDRFDNYFPRVCFIEMVEDDDAVEHWPKKMAVNRKEN